MCLQINSKLANAVITKNLIRLYITVIIIKTKSKNRIYIQYAFRKYIFYWV